jgi:hypothetical protein
MCVVFDFFFSVLLVLFSWLVVCVEISCITHIYIYTCNIVCVFMTLKVPLWLQDDSVVRDSSSIAHCHRGFWQAYESVRYELHNILGAAVKKEKYTY